MNKNNSINYRLMKLKIIILSILTLLVIVSCEDMINVDQPDIIEQDQAFIDKNSTRLSLLGIYGLMTDLVEPMFLAGEVRADLTTAVQSANPYIKEYSNNSFSASNPHVSPEPFYKIINNANDFIQEFERKTLAMEMDSVDFFQYKSELVAIRVWAQYQIAKIYGSCKYYTPETDTIDGPGSVEYTYDDTAFMRILVNDLTFSDTIEFTNITDDVIWQTVRFSDFYVNYLLGELLMEVGDYENAVKKFTEVASFGDRGTRVTGRFKIQTAFKNMWYYDLFYMPWETSSLTDNVIFMIAFNNKYNQSNELWNWTLSANYQVAPADWYYEKFSTIATADLENTDNRVYSIRPYFNNESRSSKVISKYIYDDRPYILTRTARMILLKAICLNSQGETSKAIKEIDSVRKRVGGASIDSKQMPANANEAIDWVEDIILDELAYDTGFEGERWYDIMRAAKRRNNPAFLADKVAQKYPEESREKLRTRLLDQSNWYIPVF